MPKDCTVTTAGSISAAAELHPSVATRAVIWPPARRTSVVGIPSRLRYGFVPSSYMPLLSSNGVGPAVKVEEVPKHAATKSAATSRVRPKLRAGAQSGQLHSRDQHELEETALAGPSLSVPGDTLLDRGEGRRPEPTEGGNPVREVEALEGRFRLENAIEAIDTLNDRIDMMERTEQRLKKQLKEERERLKNSKAGAESVLHLLVLAEEKIAEAEDQVTALKEHVDRYRRWWLTEYYSLKVLVTKLSHTERVDVYHLMESAHARFETFSNTGL